jgi:hypothetical protein
MNKQTWTQAEAEKMTQCQQCQDAYDPDGWETGDIEEKKGFEEKQRFQSNHIENREV